MKLILALTVLVFALAVPAATMAAPATVSCSNYGFESQAAKAAGESSTALRYFNLDAYKAAEAWALRSWRTMNATAPCAATYRRYRTYYLNGTAALWNAIRMYRASDLDQAARLLGKARRWLDLSAAEQSNW